MNSQYMYNYINVSEPITQMFRRNLSMQDLQNYASLTDLNPDIKKSVDYSLMPPLERLDDNDLPFTSGLYQVHPKKKIRIAYDKELAEMTIVNSTLIQSDCNICDVPNNHIDKYFSNNRLSNDNCCQTLSCVSPSAAKQRTQSAFKYVKSANRSCNNSGLQSMSDSNLMSHPPDLIPITHSIPSTISESLTPPRSTTPEYPPILKGSFEQTILPGNACWNSNFLEPQAKNTYFPINAPPRLSGNISCAQNDPKAYMKENTLPNNPTPYYDTNGDQSADQPEDLRVNSNERLKDVARGICNSTTIPLLRSWEIPTIISLESISRKGQRMSADTLCHSFQKSARDLPKSPPCGVSCSSNYHDHFTSPHSSSSNSHQSSPPNCRNKDGSWPDTEVPVPRHSHGTPPHHKPLRQPSQQCYPDDRAEDPEGYLRKPIDTWTYADVVFFLMEACKEIRIDPNEVQFKSTDNGAALLQMSPGDFEVLAANNGQKLYDYFVKFKTQHYMISESQNVRPSYNNYGEHYSMLHPEPYSPCEDHHNNLPPPGFPDHYHGYPEYHNHRESPYGSPSSFHHEPESPSQEYVPQGAQYTSGHDQHHAFHSPEDRNGRYHDAPSAAGKTFPPLHNYDDEASDQDESEDEKPPEPPKKRGPGRPPKPENERKRKAKKTGRLWEFIRNLLLDPKTCPSLVRWEDHQEGVFRIVQSDVIANKWGMRKNNEKMNYEKLSRAMRYYYKAKIFEPVLGKRLVYKFGSNAKGWRPLNPNNPNFQNAY